MIMRKTAGRGLRGTAVGGRCEPSLVTIRDRGGRAAPERLAASQYGVITRAEAALCGLTPRMIESRIRPGGPWQRLLPGVYLTQTGEPSGDQLLMAALRYAGDDSMVTGLAALRRHKIRVPATQLVDVLVPHVRRRSSRGFVVLHRTIRVPPMYWADGPIRYAPPARAVADAAAGLSRLGDVRAVVAGAVQQGWCWRRWRTGSGRRPRATSGA